MTAIAATAPTGHAGPMYGMQPVCAVHLVNRRTGALHRINGRPLTLFSRHPGLAAADLLTGRDPAQWEVRIAPIDPLVRR